MHKIYRKAAVAFLSGFFLTVFTLAAAPSFSWGQSSDLIHLAASQSNGNRYIKIFDGAGNFIESIPISSAYNYAKFLAGNWVSGSSSIMALYENERSIYQAAILNSTGDLVVRIKLGKKIFRVLALDYDGSGFSDLAVQLEDGSVQVYLDPGNGSTAVVDVSVPQFSDIVKIPGLSHDSIGILKLPNPSLKKKKRKKKKKGYLQYTDDSASATKIKIPGQPLEVKAFRTPHNTIAFAALFKKKVKIISAIRPNTKLYRIKKDTPVLAGNYRDEGYDSLLIGNQGTNLALNHPFNPEADVILEIDLNKVDQGDEEEHQQKEEEDQKQEEENPNFCDQVNDLISRYYAAVLTGDQAEAKRIEDLLDNLGPQIAECFSGGYFEEPPSSTPKESPFSSDSASYISGSVIAYHSNTGERMGPCDKFLPAPDGPGNFLAKNSEHGGIVYLTDYGYSNGRILHNKTFKVLEQCEYTGIANGGRAHFRTGGRLPRGRHIFAADRYGETHCWRIPNGMTRVD